MASTTQTTLPADHIKNVSVFKYFTLELTRGYLLEREEEKYAQKRQRVYTFMKTPREFEKFCIYGFFQCVDAFLFVFTFLPLRILLAFLKVLTHPCGFTSSRHLLQPAQICDILKGIILVVCIFIMSYIDTSMMYHLVRGQATIKLYVFFNMLELADRLLSNFGLDILDALFWTATEPRDRRRQHLGTLPHLLLAIIYVIIHTMLILFQATVLNVAFNSYNKSLLVIMMSNNFAEIKGSLFRKVDLNHLYTIGCSDVKERFHYVVLLSLVCVRNLTEAKWDLNILWVLLPDALLVLIAEVFVDWGKHAFILKFNEIPADVYKEFKLKLALDMATSRQNQAFTDHSDLVSRRMGLTPIPLACLIFKILMKSVKLTTWLSYIILIVILMCLTAFKVLNSIILLGHSYKVIEEYDRQETESTNQSKEHSETTNHDTESSSTNQNQESQEPANENSQYSTNEKVDDSLDKKFSIGGPDCPIQGVSEENVRQKPSTTGTGKIKRNSSQILMADSYSDLTMIGNIDVIERSKEPSLNRSNITETISESDFEEEAVSEQQTESLNVNEEETNQEFPIQENVLTPKVEKESTSFPKSERFFVNLSQRKSSSREDSEPEVLVGEELESTPAKWESHDTEYSHDIERDNNMSHGHLKGE